MRVHGINNSIFIMLTKQQLIEAHEQGLNVLTKEGTAKIIDTLNNIYAIEYYNKGLVVWHTFEQLQSIIETIEQPKPKVDLSILKEGEIYYIKSEKYEYIFIFKIRTNSNVLWDANKLLRDYDIHLYCGGIRIEYIKELRLPTESELELFYSTFPELKPKKYNGRAVKCDSIEQMRYLSTKYKSEYLQYIESNLKDGYYFYEFDSDTYRMEKECEKYNIEIISFTQYCAENNIKEPKWIQGFEVGKEYNDVVMCSYDNILFIPQILTGVFNTNYPFVCENGDYVYCRYARRNEINEIKFID
jgi:hypothetical protein